MTPFWPLINEFNFAKKALFYFDEFYFTEMAGMKLILRMRKLKKDMFGYYEFVMDEIANFALSVKRKFWALVTTFVMLGLCLVVCWAVPFLFLVLVGLFCAFLAVMTPIWTLGTILNFLFVSFMLAIYEYISNFLLYWLIFLLFLALCLELKRYF